MVEEKNSSLGAVRKFNGEARPFSHSYPMLEGKSEVQLGEAQPLLCNKETMVSTAQQIFTFAPKLIAPTTVNAEKRRIET